MTKSYASSGSTRSPEGGIEMAQKVRPNNSFKPTPLRGGLFCEAGFFTHRLISHLSFSLILII